MLNTHLLLYFTYITCNTERMFIQEMQVFMVGFCTTIPVKRWGAGVERNIIIVVGRQNQQ